MSELKQLKNLFDQAVNEEVETITEKIVKTVSEKYGHNREEIYELLQSFRVKINEDESEQCQETLINQLKCMGKTKYNTQCSRSRQGETVFCGSHSTKLPYGRMDEESNEDKSTKKRGRPRK